MCNTDRKRKDVVVESKRLEKFKSTLIKIIPFFPNNKETLRDLEKQSTCSVMFHYIHWVSRLIPQRPRKISIENYVVNDQRWKIIEGNINMFLAKVERGDDLTPHLSLKAHNKGYTPAKRIIDGDADIWDDKDFLLNTMGFHHFHLGLNVNSNGVADRTDEVVFVHVTREEFRVIAIFNHLVFDSEVNDKNELNSERKRLRKIFEEYSSRGVSLGMAYLPMVQTTSGHPLHVHDITMQYTYVLNEIDPKLEDEEFLSKIYDEAGISIPKNNKVVWHMFGLDLGLLDKEKTFLVLRYGPV